MKKKSQLIGGILLMVLGLGLGLGTIAFHHIERGGMGPFNAGHRISTRQGFMGNNGCLSPQTRGFNQNRNPRQAPFPKQAPAIPSAPEKP